MKDIRKLKKIYNFNWKVDLHKQERQIEEEMEGKTREVAEEGSKTKTHYFT